MTDVATGSDRAGDEADDGAERIDVAIIGAGSAGEALVRELAGHELDVVLFEPDLVGGECPFYACMPSKSMLHDAKLERTWDEAVERRGEIVSHLDDTGHREDAREQGATIVSAAAVIVGEHLVEADGRRWRAEHVVVATGADPVVPDIDGLDELGDRRWTSADALTATDRPDRLGIIGGGIIGGEVAQMYSGLGVEVTMIDTDPGPAEGMHPRLAQEVSASMERAGVTSIYGVEPTSCRLDGDDVVIEIDGADPVRCDVVLVAVGRRPATDGLGLESLGLDPGELDVDDHGGVGGLGWLWIAGDAAGREQYTHVANRHAAVLADRIVGDGELELGSSVIPACQFIDPPLMVVGPTYAELEGDDDVVWAGTEVEVPRRSTDELPGGYLALAARRSTGCLVAANGVGPRFDELVHALVVAIDGQVPVSVLARTIQPFPTVGECLGVAFGEVLAALEGD